MLNPADLVRGGKLVADAVERAAADPSLAQALASPPADGAQAAALAIAAGLARAAAAQTALLALLGRDDLAGPAAAWALSRLDSEAAVLAAIESGGIDVRQNGYQSLATRAALGKASPGLAAAMTARVQAENARAKQKLTGLGEHALKVLAVLGAPGSDDLIQQVLEADPYTDKFELQRLRKAVADGGRDRDTIAALSAPWTTVFTDALAGDPAPTKPAAPEPPPVAKPAAANPVAPKPLASKPAAPPPPTDDALFAEDGADGGDTGGEAGTQAQPIDWKAFMAGPEATALPAPVRGLIGQLGPLLEQLAARAINAPLTDLAGQELAALLLQVLPQALPPQHLQAALSPQALNGYQALARYLARTGLATHGDDLVQGVKLVRQQLQQQMRQSGILGGPDYSDPDEPKAP